MKYEIIMNNGNTYDCEYLEDRSYFFKRVNSNDFIEAHKYTTQYGRAERLTVFLSTKNISEIIPWKE